MTEFSYTITDEQGIHARPAGLLVKEAAKFDAETTLTVNGKSASAKRLFAIMGLAAKNGDMVNIHIEGSDENEAETALLQFLTEHL